MQENEKNLTSKVEAINALLRAFGRQAVQEIKMMKNGQVIGPVFYLPEDNILKRLKQKRGCFKDNNGEWSQAVGQTIYIIPWKFR